MQTTKEVNPHPRIAPCVNMWSVFFFFFFFCHLLNVGACVRHIVREGQVEWTTLESNCPHISFVLFHNVTCYTNSIISSIHVNTIKLHNITCTLVATSVIRRSLECIQLWKWQKGFWFRLVGSNGNATSINLLGDLLLLEPLHPRYMGLQRRHKPQLGSIKTLCTDVG